MRVLYGVIIALAAIAAFATSGIWLWHVSALLREPIPPPDPVMDSAIINRTEMLPEVKLFMERYPNATVFINRDFTFAVNHQITREDLTGIPEWRNETNRYVPPYLSFNVRLDSNGMPKSSVLWCTTNEHGQYKIEIQNESDLQANLDKAICKLI